ncbi:MAG: hypothetical protein AAF549_06415, partial [Pseudomonadota bacterium]
EKVQNFADVGGALSIPETAQDRFNRQQFEAQQGFANGAAFTQEAQAQAEEDRRLKSTQTLRQAEATSRTVTEGFFNSVYNSILDEITETQADLDQVRERVIAHRNQLGQQEEALGAAEADVVETGEALSEAEAEAARRNEIAEQREAEAAEISGNHDTLMTGGDWTLANMMREDVARAGVAARDAEDNATEAEADAEAARQEYDTAVSIRDGIQAEINRLTGEISQMEGDIEALQRQLEEYEAAREYMDDPDTIARLQSGELTTQDLRDNGVPESIIEQVEMNGPETGPTGLGIETNEVVETADLTTGTTTPNIVQTPVVPALG